MNHVDITLYLNEYRVRALADALGNQTAETVEDKLMEAFDMLYQEYVPDEQRSAIEAKIEREDADEQARLEAKRRFAVYHVRENGEDYHFTSDHFRTPMQAAYRYRLYDRGELSSTPIRIAAYCRVSSDSRDQEQSFAAQVRYYTQAISQMLFIPAMCGCRLTKASKKV